MSQEYYDRKQIRHMSSRYKTTHFKNVLGIHEAQNIEFSLTICKSPYSSLFTGSFLALLIFLSIAGNILVCVAIYTERSLRRIGNLFLASLAIADLFVASLVMTFAGVNDILGGWNANQAKLTWNKFEARRKREIE